MGESSATPDAWLTHLNHTQREAVEFGIAQEDERALLVIAGAGSGKTNTLAYRVAQLIRQGADPARIMLLTFSRCAAEETTRRIARIVNVNGHPSKHRRSGHSEPMPLTTLPGCRPERVRRIDSMRCPPCGGPFHVIGTIAPCPMAQPARAPPRVSPGTCGSNSSGKASLPFASALAFGASTSVCQR